MSSRKFTKRCLLRHSGKFRSDKVSEPEKKAIYDLVKKFIAEVWLDGLRQQVLGSIDRARSLAVSKTPYEVLKDRDPVMLLSYGVVAQSMVQAERGETFITMEFGPSLNPGVYLSDINATYEEARLLIEDAIAQWRAGCSMRPNHNVVLD